MAGRGGSDSVGTHNGPADSPRAPKHKNMHSEVAQMMLSANIRNRNRCVAAITIGEVEEVIQKEEGKLSRIDQGIDAIFNRRGANPIPMEQVREEYAH